MGQSLQVGDASPRGRHVDPPLRQPLCFADEAECEQDETLAFVTFYFFMFLIKLPGSLTPCRDYETQPCILLMIHHLFSHIVIT